MNFHETMEEINPDKLPLLLDFLRDNEIYKLAKKIENHYSCWICKDEGEIDEGDFDDITKKKCIDCKV